MEVIEQFAIGRVASVLLGRTSLGKEVECVESTQPSLGFAEKEVLIVSTLVGCPVACSMCDAGGFYHGKLSKQEILEQIDTLVFRRYGSRRVSAKQFKIQFSRMGDPAFNEAVLDVLEELPGRYQAPGLLPSLSTVAPQGTEPFFERLMSVKKKLFSGRFQFQFSVHSTNPQQRREIVPINSWSLQEMADYGNRFYEAGDRKIGLNFALGKDNIVEPHVLSRHFNPGRFLIKITPINPTYRSKENGIESGVDVDTEELTHHPMLLPALKEAGFDVIVSIGDVAENKIGSNCGQFVKRHLLSGRRMQTGYEQV